MDILIFDLSYHFNPGNESLFSQPASCSYRFFMGRGPQMHRINLRKLLIAELHFVMQVVCQFYFW